MRGKVLFLLQVLLLNMASFSVKALKHGVVWFKDADLRLLDHKAFYSAHLECDNVDHVYCFDTRNYIPNKETGYERVNFRRFKFLVESVNDVQRSLAERGSRLRVFLGRPEEILPSLLTPETSCVYCSEEVTSEELNIVSAVSKKVTAAAPRARVSIHWSGYLVDKADLPIPLARLDMFTSFRKAVESAGNLIGKPCLDIPVLKPQSDRPAGLLEMGSTDDAFAVYEAIMTALKLPINYDISSVHADERAVLPFQGGEAAAIQRLEHYCTVGLLDRYKQTRNGMVGADYSTKMSPWLALGCISARTIYQRIKLFEKTTGIANEDTYWVVFELLWRDYMRFYGLKYGARMFQLLGPQGLSAKNKYPWRRDLALLQTWCRGQTGYPFIDANMRELMYTCFMSNRGRQNVASFLVRDMGLDWRLGALHFERFLLDYDPCSNYGNWQYAAGVGSDPREDRYFNIVKQASGYDPDCAYIRLWCPELSHLPNALLINPSKITQQDRVKYNLSLDVLPMPVVSLLHVEFKGASGSKKDYTRQSKHGDVPGRKPKK